MLLHMAVVSAFMRMLLLLAVTHHYWLMHSFCDCSFCFVSDAYRAHLFVDHSCCLMKACKYAF